MRKLTSMIHRKVCSINDNNQIITKSNNIIVLDYKTGFGGQYGVQSDRVDKSALGWDHREQVAKHESQARQSDYKAAGFSSSAGNDLDQSGPVGTNYVKTKPDSKFISSLINYSRLS